MLEAFVENDSLAAQDDALTIIRKTEKVANRVQEELKFPSNTMVATRIALFSNRRQLNRFIDRSMPDAPHRRAFSGSGYGYARVSGKRQTIYSFQCNETLEADLRHEIIHTLLSSQNVPIWLDEGLAEYYEPGTNRDGTAVINSEQLQVLLSSPDWQPDLRRLESLPTDHRMSKTEYAESWLWTHMLMTDPGSRGMVQQFLADRRLASFKGIPCQPIYVRLQQITSDPDRAARAHFDRLASGR